MADSSAFQGSRLPVDAQERCRAIASLLKPGGGDQAVARFEALLEARGCGPDALRLADTPSGDAIAALVVPGPGRVGVLLLSPLPGPGAAAAAALASADALDACNKDTVAMVQALIDPGDRLRQASLEQAGLHELALLHTMERSLPRKVTTPTLPRGVELLPCIDMDPDRVARTLERTYEGTLDCPGLLGLRDPLDTLRGHRATGNPVSDLWCIVQLDAADAGLMLVSRQSDAIDLIYVGLAPEARRRGIGHALMQTMLHSLHRGQPKRIRLSVDSANTPAMALYEALGFATVTTSRALIWSADATQASPKDRSCPPVIDP